MVNGTKSDWDPVVSGQGRIQDFSRGGSNVEMGGSFTQFYTKILEIPHENEIIWLQRGVRANPLNPL